MLEPESQERLSWVDTVRLLHRNKRYAGYIGCIIGGVVLTWAKFVASPSPPWGIPLGLGVIIVSWLVFVYVVVAKWLWIKKHPFPK